MGPVEMKPGSCQRGTVPEALLSKGWQAQRQGCVRAFLHLFLKPSLEVKYHYAHFREKETKAQRGFVI